MLRTQKTFELQGDQHLPQKTQIDSILLNAPTKKGAMQVRPLVTRSSQLPCKVWTLQTAVCQDQLATANSLTLWNGIHLFC